MHPSQQMKYFFYVLPAVRDQRLELIEAEIDAVSALLLNVLVGVQVVT